MDLSELVRKYQTLAGAFGRPVALADFGMSHPDTERLFSLLDEDYHISRFIHFSLGNSGDQPPATYNINGFLQSHVSLDAEIESIL